MSPAGVTGFFLTLLFSRAGGLSDQGHRFSGIIARFESNHCGLFSADNLTNDEFEIDARFAQCFRYCISETGFVIAFHQQSRNRSKRSSRRLAPPGPPHSYAPSRTCPTAVENTRQ